MKHTILEIRAFLLLVLLICTINQLDAQNAAGQTTKRIYIHYDKESYLAGETVWFKAYFLNNGKPDGSCNNFYLQLFGPGGELVSVQKLPVEGATARGSLDLPDTLVQGYYTIRAFTPTQLSAPPASMYKKPLFVFNRSNPGETVAAETGKATPPILFYPEGGYLTEGVLSALLFETRDEKGRPAPLSGMIKMDDSVVVAPFKSELNGTGRIQIKPLAGKKYTAVINSPAGTTSYLLPEVKPSGVNIKIEDEPGGKLFTISRTRKEKEKYSKLFFVAEQNGMPVYENEIAFDNFYSVKGHLVTRDLPSGLIRFVLYNEQMEVLQERMGMVDNGEYRSPGDIVLVKKGTGKRSENIFQLQFPEVLQRSCSVSIIALEKTDGPVKTNIISHAILGDFPDEENNLAAYFTGNRDSVARHELDSRLLIAGLKQKPANEKNNMVTGVPVKDNYLMSLQGYLVSNKTKQPVSGGTLSMFFEAEDSADLNFAIPVDAKGQFFADSLLFRGRTKLHLAYNNEKGAKEPAEIFIQSNLTDSLAATLPFFVEPVKGNQPATLQPSSNLGGPNALVNMKTVGKELEGVVVSGSKYRKPIDEVNDKYTTGVFRSMGKYNYDNISQPENNRSLSVYDYVLRSIRDIGVQDNNFVNKRNHSLFTEITSEQMAKRQDSLDKKMDAAGGYAPGSVRYIDMGIRDPGKNYIISVFINESPAMMSFLKTITMDQVALVKFYGPGFVGAGGTDGPGGALSIYTKKGIEMTVPEKKADKQDAIPVNGYSMVKKFFSPDYATGQAGDIVDRRKTLYWNPDIYTNTGNPSVELKFYHNDLGGSYKIIIQGFDVNGRLIYKELVVDN